MSNCKAYTTEDRLCTRTAQKGSDYCWQHLRARVEIEVNMDSAALTDEPVDAPDNSGSLAPINTQNQNDNLGLAQVSMALAGISTAIAAFLPSIDAIPQSALIYLSFLAGTLATLSAYSSLWLFSLVYLGKENSGYAGILAILRLLASFRLGPYWLVGMGLFIWFVFAIFLTVLLLVESLGISL